MKYVVFAILLCLLLTGSVSALSPGIELGVTVANPGIPTDIHPPLAFTDCSDDSASVGTLPSMGELDVDSTPDGASVTLDGSPWTYKRCKSGWPTPTCISLPVDTPYTGDVETGSHSITIAKTGYKSYTGIVTICSQKVSYVHKTLTAVTTTKPTTAVTSTATSTGTATTATPATTAVTPAETPSTPTAPVTLLTTTTTTGTPLAAVSVSFTSTTVPEGSGSLSITTTPAGAAVYIDGVQRGVSPATIPGLTPGSHTVLLKLYGYQDLATPVSIIAGTTSEFSTGLTLLPEGATTVPATATKTRSPGFEAAAAACAVGALLLRKTIP